MAPPSRPPSHAPRPSARVFSGAVLAGGPVVLAALSGTDARTPREREIERRARERGLAEGLGQGREAGLAEGRRAAEADMGSAAQALAGAARELTAHRARLLATSQGAVLHLALAIARKMVHGEIRYSAGTAARVVEAACQSAGDAAVVAVRVHPTDHRRLEELGASVPELVADPAIAPGGCLVETDCGALDATVESRWHEVEAALRGAAEQLLAATPPAGAESVGAWRMAEAPGSAGVPHPRNL